jgi:membrane protease YdiL (CAAX protease family)
MRSIATGAGLAVLSSAPVVLLLTGRTQVAVSADDEAGTIPLVAVVVPVLVGLLFIRLVPPRLPTMGTVTGAERVALCRQAVLLVALALAFPALALVLHMMPGGDYLYGPVKVLLLLGGAWLVVRRSPFSAPARAHRDRLPRRWYWLGPVPAVAAWAYLLYCSPWGEGERDLSGYRSWDPVLLAGAMLLTFLTASVLEEVFYRMLLQTRLEALLGRWAGITVTALLFAAMHVHRVGDGPLWEITTVVIAFNGGFGLFVGYLWSRYRNIWALIVVHGAVNSVGLLPLLF